MKSTLLFFKNFKTAILFLAVLLIQANEAFAQATFSVRVSTATDDMEEYISGPNTLGTMDATSSDLELGHADNTSGTLTNAQLVGIRFNNITIPKDAVITKAYIQFTVDASNKNADPSDLTIVGEAVDNSVTFDPLNNFNLSARPKTTASVNWSIPAGSWASASPAPVAGLDQRTSDIKTVVQEIISRNGWLSGNSLALYISGSGLREAEAYDGDAPNAPLLVIEYFVKKTISIRVNAATDDMEEYISGPNTLGTMDATSSDLELGHADNTSGTLTNAQLVGIRFNNITIPKEAIITNAHIQFTVDASNKNADPSSLTVVGEAVDNAVTFDPLVNFNLSVRPKTTASVSWAIPAGSWASASPAPVAGSDQRTSDIKTVIQEIINRSGWASGNSLALYLTGSGLREAEAYDGDAPNAALLVVEYLGLPDVSEPPVTGNPTTSFPIIKQDTWSYLDNGTDQGTAWCNSAFTADNTWAFENGTFGYGDPVDQLVSKGPDANNVYVTTYFLKRFTVTSVAALTNTLDLNLLCDDGAIVYINGVEALRYNLPMGVIASSTYATATIGGADETTYFNFEIAKSFLVDGENIIAVELHQATPNSSDLKFDLELKQHVATTPDNTAALGCTEEADHIACFTSLLPTGQGHLMNIPSSHAFQVLFSENDAYSKNGGSAIGGFDFTGFIPENMTNSRKGHLSINHETNPGALSMLDLHYDPIIEKWVVDSSQGVSFNAVVKTERNCSGGVTPWETVITCEETTAAGDADGDGYEDVGWHVEIDPKASKIKQYGNGRQEKLWAMGRMNHENVVLKKDSLTAYYGDDTGSGNVFKFVANSKTNLYSGTLYVLKLASGLVNNEPTATTGTWEVVPNGTPVECNTTKSLAAGLGATPFNGVEDVEIGPLDNKIYFTAKGNSRTYRFSDNGSTVSDFETFVGGMSYQINYGASFVNEAWGTGNDNLTFDNHGNLWVLQDGGRNHVWLVRPDHSQAAPKVELFMITPSGSEPTGMTFSPDYKFMFISIQSPDGANSTTQLDATGTAYAFNKNRTVVIARKEMLDGMVTSAMSNVTAKYALNTFPNPSRGEFNVSFKLNEPSDVKVVLMDLSGKQVVEPTDYKMNTGEHTIKLNTAVKGTHILQLVINGEIASQQIVIL